MPPSSRPQTQAARGREEGNDVLRYWLASLRLEEALQVRPAARQPPGGAGVPRLEQPSPGQDYFKVPLDASLVGLLSEQTHVTRPFDAELCGFFETWLHGQYRRGDDEGELSHLLCFPVVHLPKGELAGLLRCGLRLRFGSGGTQPFRVPTRAERQRGSYPPPPSEARLTRVPVTDGSWPFFIDVRLLRQQLGVPTESIDALFEALRKLPRVSERQLLARLVTMLEGVASEAPGAPEASTAAEAERLETAAAAEGCALDEWLTRLTAALRRLLAQSSSRARVYPVGIVVDGTQAKTTWYLQRELETLLEGQQGWKLASPLGAYLTGQPLPAGASPQRALFPGPPLSPSQRAAADAFWGSRLSAVQGPPGTGKTRLILHLCAEHLVRHAEGLLDLGRPRAGLLLVTSGNNRAVDNVIEPLTALPGLPVALRAGSRQVCEQQLSAQLRRALSWLQHAKAESESNGAERLARARAHFLARRDALERVLAPRRRAAQRAAERARWEHVLAQCGGAAEAASGVSVSEAQAKTLLLTLAPLERRFQALSELCEAEPTPTAVHAAELHYRRTRKRKLPALTRALDEAQLKWDLPPPPAAAADRSHAQQLEDWEEFAEATLTRWSEFRLALEHAATTANLTARAGHARAQLAALKPEPDATDEPAATYEEESRQLFEAALAVREAWAAERAEELAAAVSTALRTIEQERSLRAVFRGQPDAARLLSRLFGIWGSTLLSLGNCFPAEPGSIGQLVIDEAGQCHPAHAVSALMRAESALVIGDVHQLSPVIELSADDEARLLRNCRLRTPAHLLHPYRVHADAETSTQSLADRAVRTRGRLTDHFRCQPEIITLCDRLCDYGLTIHTPRADRSRHAPYLRRAVSLVDLRGQQTRLAGSWCNDLELGETLTLVESLLNGGVRADELAVITPYRGQLERLRRAFLQLGVPLERSAELAEAGEEHHPSGLSVGTVHRFQGGERSIVLFSSVVTQAASLTFLNSRPNLLNVAISRAQHHFVCLGHATLLSQGPLSRVLVEGASPLLRADYCSHA